MPNHTELARTAAAEGIVLLKNEGLLPLPQGKRLAIFSNGPLEYFKSGRGSGNVRSAYEVSIPQGLENSGFQLDQAIAELYRQNLPVAPENLAEAAARTDTAVVILSRNSTEFWDRSIEYEFSLQPAEWELLMHLQASEFTSVLVILNIAGPIEMKFLQAFSKIKAVLLVWLPGMEGGNAVADIISGKINPSGKLTDTLAFTYADYPCAANHHYFADTVYYEEDVFIGYRYFETIPQAGGKVAFPFGFGLSYTSFSFKIIKFQKDEKRLRIELLVENTGLMTGKEVVQAYVSPPQHHVDRPLYELKGFCKTRLLAPGENEEVTISVPVADLAYFDEEKAAYMLAKGRYEIFVGKHVRDLQSAGCFTIEKEVTTFQTSLKLSCRLPSRLRANGHVQKSVYFDQRNSRTPSGACFTVPVAELVKKRGIHTLYDVYEGRLSLEAFISELSIEEMIHLCQAQPPAVPRGTAGVGNSLIRQIPNVQTADGPAGLRVSTPTTCFPCATLLACTWNTKLLEQIGRAMGEECVAHHIDILLAPALNLHRDPLCGRNFEYYSEDPLVSGKAAAAVVRGIQSCGVAATVKHLACNNQERFRIFSNSIVSERALREIYLKGFEIAVKEGKPWCLMTAYNLVNHIRSSSHYGLITGILRDEWGYQGAVMTDWRTDSHLFEEIKAGNNIKMPFGYPDEIELAMQYAGLHNLSREELESSVSYILRMIMKTQRFLHHDFGKIHSISATQPTIIHAVELSCVSHTWVGIEPCSDDNGGQNIRRLQKDMRGNDSFITYLIQVDHAGDYTVCLRFAAEKTTAYFELVLDGESKGSFAPLKPAETSKEWDEDARDAAPTPKIWVDSDQLRLYLSNGRHELKLYVRTKNQKDSMSLCSITVSPQA